MAGEVHEINEMAFDDMRKAVLEECRRTEKLADALLQDDRQHRLVPDLVRNIKTR